MSEGREGSGLQAPPASLVTPEGGPAHGRYAGVMPRFDWSALRGEHRRPAWWRALHHKRWQYVGLGSDEVFVGLAIVHVGWCLSAFAYVFDRRQRRVLVDWSQEGLPGLAGAVSDQPVAGLRSHFRGLGGRLSLTQDEATGALQVVVVVPGMRLEAEVQTHSASPYLCAVGPIAGGVAHATQKSPALAVRGSVQVGAQRWCLDRAVACLDSSNGLLARDTRWHWACAHGEQLGFNLQQGYFGACENVLWLHGEMILLGAAHFDFDPRVPLQPWHVHTDDGLLDLMFTPEGAREQHRDLGVVVSDYIQPVGTFHGQVSRSAGESPVVVQGLLGVTEDHRSLW
ncbi:MAG TPA: DUF2804 domain-containing protein [Aquabacterium sp.]|uniref:DUF2804 domain-containing protein n=1 Tax=Aquabacterium sp. TaxID=1872578 RepID=UPI002E3547D3|nr:DUF2804 domain-containing protein [Aquabacterium sp.]HEX5372057.1 DUF2804 domain-containing protein [Aquabacterium sp.]